jgi:hypothetical protein
MTDVIRSWSDISKKVVGAVLGGIVAGGGAIAGGDQVILWLWNGVFGFAGGGGEMPATVAAVIWTVVGAFIGGYVRRENVPADAAVVPSKAA